MINFVPEQRIVWAGDGDDVIDVGSWFDVPEVATLHA